MRSLAGLSPKIFSTPNQIKIAARDTRRIVKEYLFSKPINQESKSFTQAIAFSKSLPLLIALVANLSSSELKEHSNHHKLWHYSNMELGEVTVVFDGECRFCRASLGWLQKKLQVKAIAFQEAPLEKYGLTFEQCSKEVFALSENKTYSGAGAVAYLLNLRGNTKTSMFIKSLGPIGRSGYRWIASHRNSILVRVMTKILERS